MRKLIAQQGGPAVAVGAACRTRHPPAPRGGLRRGYARQGSAAAAAKAPRRTRRRLFRPGKARTRARAASAARCYYARRYGVDQLQVRSISSGSSLEFRYRVLDAQKAGCSNDKSAKPYLVDQKTEAG